MNQDVAKAVIAAANAYKIPYANLMAVVEIESNGVTGATVSGKREPLIRWEGHYFYNRLSGSNRDKAVAQKLAHPKAGGIPNPSSQQSRWDNLLTPGSRINPEAAMESCSWGLGQVMGANWLALGYGNVDELVRIARSGVAGQIELMMRFCVVNNLIGMLQRGDFTPFARAYNGPAHQNYDVKMRDAAKRHAKTTPPAISYDDAIPIVVIATGNEMLTLGSKGLKVRELQALLLRAGHAIKVDGDFGPATRAAVIKHQTAEKITADGAVGPATWATLDKYRIDGSEQPGAVTNPMDTPEGMAGALGAVIGAAILAVATILPAWAGTAAVGLGVVALLGAGGAMAYGWWKANRVEQ